MAAIGKSQAIIEFGLDGKVLTANDNFLKVLGYSLAEVVGRHHSIFVAPADVASADYQVFWDKLGLAVGDELAWPGPGGKAMTVQVKEIVYQPESSGELHR